MQVGDIGTTFTMEVQDPDGVAVNIASATALTMKFKRPSGGILTKTGTLSAGGTDGKFYYAVIANDLNEAGKWEYQGIVVLPTGTWYTSVVSFDVKLSLT